jgi:hypothetical protein
MIKTKKIVVFLAAISLGANARTIIVEGVVSALTTPVRYASVTFIDKNDTSRKFSALTNTSGNYQIRIFTSLKSNDNLPCPP